MRPNVAALTALTASHLFRQLAGLLPLSRKERNGRKMALQCEGRAGVLLNFKNWRQSVPSEGLLSTGNRVCHKGGGRKNFALQKARGARSVQCTDSGNITSFRGGRTDSPVVFPLFFWRLVAHLENGINLNYLLRPSWIFLRNDDNSVQFPRHPTGNRTDKGYNYGAACHQIRK